MQEAIVNGERKARHEVMPNIFLDNAPAIRSVQNRGDGGVGGIKKPGAKSWNPAFVELRRLDKFLLGVGVVDQPHPIARRAARMTCSWVRPSTAPEDNS